MAVIYLRSTDGDDADDGSTWALAKATLAAALTAAGAGGTVYVSQVHAETQATALGLLSPGTPNDPVTVLCVNDGAEPPTTLAASASVTSTASASIGFAGFTYYHGMNFYQGAGGSGGGFAFTGSASNFWVRFSQCLFQINGSGTTAALTIGQSGNQSGCLVEWDDCRVVVGNTSQKIILNNHLRWRGGSIQGATLPSALLSSAPGTGGMGYAQICGVDLSLLGSGKSLVDVGANKRTVIELVNCKLGSSVAVSSGSHIGQGGPEIMLVNCDSADTNYRYHKESYQGIIAQESTIVRSGGASDGTTAISRKMVTSANSKFYSPLELGPLAVWNETTGSQITATVEVVTDGVTLTDAEAWLEVEYLGTSGYPLSLFASDRAADIFASAANQTSSSETWTTTGLTSPVKQKLSVAFTPQEKGPIKFRVMLAKASTTMYVCPKVDLT